MVCVPVAWSGPTAARIDSPRNTTSTVAPFSQKPHTNACLGAAARIMPSPTAAAKRKAAAAAAVGPGGGSHSCIVSSIVSSTGPWKAEVSITAKVARQRRQHRGMGW